MQEINLNIFPQEIEIKIFKYLYLLLDIKDVLSIRLISTSANQAFREVDVNAFQSAHFIYSKDMILEDKIKMLFLLNHYPKLNSLSFFIHLKEMHISLYAMEDSYQLNRFAYSNFFLTCKDNVLKRLISICSDYLENSLFFSAPENNYEEIINNHYLTQIMTYFCFRFGTDSESLRDIIEIFIIERTHSHNFKDNRSTLLLFGEQIPSYWIENIVCCVATEDDGIFSLFWDRIPKKYIRRMFYDYSSAVINMFSFKSFLLLVKKINIDSHNCRMAIPSVVNINRKEYLSRLYSKVITKINAIKRYVTDYNPEYENKDSLEIIIKMRDVLETKLREIDPLFNGDDLDNGDWPEFYPPELEMMRYSDDLDSDNDSEQF